MLKIDMLLCVNGELICWKRCSETVIFGRKRPFRNSNPSFSYGTSRVDSRLAPIQWEMSLQSNAVYHWLGAHLKSALTSHMWRHMAPEPLLLVAWPAPNHYLHQCGIIVNWIITNFSEIFMITEAFYWNKCISRCHMQNVNHFVPVAMC